MEPRHSREAPEEALDRQIARTAAEVRVHGRQRNTGAGGLYGSTRQAPRRNGSGLLRVEGDSELVVVRADAGQARLSCRKRHETERDLACTRR